MGPFVPFRAVGFANGRVGWAGTLIKEQMLFETRDGGDTWEARYTTTGNLGEWGWKISFSTPTTGSQG